MYKTVLAFGFMLGAAITAHSQTQVDSLKQNPVPLPHTRDSLFKPLPFAALVPANFYTTHLPFFCDRELKLQKAVKFPVKIRLGSLADCNRLEGKQ